MIGFCAWWQEKPMVRAAKSFCYPSNRTSFHPLIEVHSIPMGQFASSNLAFWNQNGAGTGALEEL